MTWCVAMWCVDRWSICDVLCLLCRDAGVLTRVVMCCELCVSCRVVSCCGVLTCCVMSRCVASCCGAFIHDLVMDTYCVVCVTMRHGVVLWCVVSRCVVLLSRCVGACRAACCFVRVCCYTLCRELMSVVSCLLCRDASCRVWCYYMLCS